ncbi:MAG: SRPBCC family protein [Dehalococcoidia bacterium]
MAEDNGDRIEKRVTLKASPERVWNAISNAKEFGAWFGVDFLGQAFEPGASLTGKMTDPPEYAGVDFNIDVAEIEAPRMISFRWHPFAGDVNHDYSGEPMTLIEFVVTPQGGGTLLTVTESGFLGIPEARRRQAFDMNSEGWAQQLVRVANYVDGQ